MDSLLFALQDTIQQAQPVEMPNMGTMLIRMIFSLVFVVALIVGLFYVLKKINLPTQKLSSGADKGKILDSLLINNRQSIQIVYLLNRIYILAVSPEEIRPIEIITDSAKITEFLENFKTKKNNNFTKFLSKYEKNNS